jgi:hypothetical protein
VLHGKTGSVAQPGFFRVPLRVIGTQLALPNNHKGSMKPARQKLG